MQAQFTTDVISYRRKVEQLSRVTGLGLRDVMRESVSIMAGQLARRFPPKNKKMGETAIKNDLNRLIITDEKVWMTGELNNGNHLLLFDSGARLAVTPANFKPAGGVGDIAAAHAVKKRQTLRTVKRQNKSYYDHGFKTIDKLYAPKTALDSYLKTQKGSVGKLKAKWSAAAEMWPGAKKLPAWITRHSDKGRVVDAMKANGNGYIEIINDAPQASEWRDVVAFVVKSQGRMLNNRIRGEIRKQAKAFEARGAR